MAADGVVGLARREEELPAARAEARIGTRPHPRQRQEAKKNEVNQRNEQFFEEGPGFLARKAADERRTARFEKADHASQTIGREPDISVEKTKKWSSRLF